MYRDSTSSPPPPFLFFFKKSREIGRSVNERIAIEFHPDVKFRSMKNESGGKKRVRRTLRDTPRNAISARSPTGLTLLNTP